MVMCLRITPLDIRGLRDEDSASLLLHLSAEGAECNVQITRDMLLRAVVAQTPLIVWLLNPKVPIPSAKRIKRASMKQESRVAEDMGGRRQTGSGALSWKKGDGRVAGKYRIENKMRFTKGITITRSDLSKIRSECSPGEVPLFQVDFANKTTTAVEDSWILVPYDHWKKVLSETHKD